MSPILEDDTLIGLANYVATPEPGCAEVSVVVAHQQHGRGVGTALLKIVAQTAHANGFHHVMAPVLRENQSMQRVSTDAGWPYTLHQARFVTTYDVDLDAAASG
jgi:RimJ/RimL family protein N-acetyltransferase